MDLPTVFSPLSDDVQDFLRSPAADSIGSSVLAHAEQFCDWEEADILVLAVYSPSNYTRRELIWDAVRKQLYALITPQQQLRIADLGDLCLEEEQRDQALSQIFRFLLEAKKRLIILADDPEVAVHQYRACAALHPAIEYLHVGPRLALDEPLSGATGNSYNRRILQQQPGHLYNFTNLGYQRYFVPESQISELKELHFPALRYGSLHANIQEAEPALRTADMMVFDLNAIRHLEFPPSDPPSSGGFTAMEACRLARYAGLAYKLQSACFWGYLPEADIQDRGAMLTAQMLWYLIDGHYGRWEDFPQKDRSNLKAFSVQMNASMKGIQFYRHQVSGRWWMEVPYPNTLGNKQASSMLVPCSAQDYELARFDEIPARWWQTYSKLM